MGLLAQLLCYLKIEDKKINDLIKSMKKFLFDNSHFLFTRLMYFLLLSILLIYFQRRIQNPEISISYTNLI